MVSVRFLGGAPRTSRSTEGNQGRDLKFLCYRFIEESIDVNSRAHGCNKLNLLRPGP